VQIYLIGCSQTRTDILDGSTRIFIECAKRWVKNGHKIQVFTCLEGYQIFQNYGLSSLSYVVIPSSKHWKRSVYLLYLIRTIKLSLMMMKLRFRNKAAVIYSGSDFWPDTLPAMLLKMRFPRAKWVAGFYLFSSFPFSDESPYKDKRALRGLFYYLSQMPAYYLVKENADMIFVTNELDRWRFISQRLKPNKVVVVRGGVDTKTSKLVSEPKKKVFDAVFTGRFHPQKGVLELVDIWRYICEKKQNAKLAMIGVGELENEVKDRILKYGLEKNVTLFGFKDGMEKIKIFKDSRVVVHPATYDSGGMAACEAMACGLPGVSFDLPALRDYYPKGMLKTPCFSLRAFGDNVIRLLENETLYQRLQREAVELAKKWDWDDRSNELLEALEKLFEDGIKHD